MVNNIFQVMCCTANTHILCIQTGIYKTCKHVYSVSKCQKRIHNVCVCQVHDTHELSASLCESLRRVMSWKFISRGKCFSTQASVMFVLPDTNNSFRNISSLTHFLTTDCYFHRRLYILGVTSPPEQKSDDVFLFF